MIDIAQQGLDEIDSVSKTSMFTLGVLVEKKEKLKNLLEDNRENIESLLVYSRCNILSRVCRNFLERILGISECLRASYAFPGYQESYYILDTLRLIDGKSDR